MITSRSATSQMRKRGSGRSWPFIPHSWGLPPAERASRRMTRTASRSMTLSGSPARCPIHVGAGGNASRWREVRHHRGSERESKTRALLHAFGRFIDRIGQTYATGEDVGITVADIDTVSEVTPFVGGTSAGAGESLGAYRGGAVARAACGSRKPLQHEPVRGSSSRRARARGRRLARRRTSPRGWRPARGSRHPVLDVVERAVHLFDAIPLATDVIHGADVDIYAPCALGGVITEKSAREIRAKAVAGAANNQLESAQAGQALAERGILFAPDYVLNAGGIIRRARSRPTRACAEGRKPVRPAPLAVHLMPRSTIGWLRSFAAPGPRGGRQRSRPSGWPERSSAVRHVGVQRARNSFARRQIPIGCRSRAHQRPSGPRPSVTSTTRARPARRTEHRRVRERLSRLAPWQLRRGALESRGHPPGQRHPVPARTQRGSGDDRSRRHAAGRLSS